MAPGSTSSSRRWQRHSTTTQPLTQLQPQPLLPAQLQLQQPQAAVLLLLLLLVRRLRWAAVAAMALLCRMLMGD